MKVLFFGAGPLGSVYAHLLHEAGKDVTVLARGERYEWIAEHGLNLVNEITGEAAHSRVKVIDELSAEDEYDLAIVLIRKNKLGPVFELLAERPRIENILFMGNNAQGFDEYLEHLPARRLLFGFPGAGGGFDEQVVHFADREKPNGKRRAVTIGEINGQATKRIKAIKHLFESSDIPVDVTSDVDGWLKYHVALIIPLVAPMYRHDFDCRAIAQDTYALRLAVRAAKEGGRVLRKLGYRRRQPFQFNLFYWMPEAMNMMGLKALLESRFAEIAFAMHARASKDEMVEIAQEFQGLIERTTVATPSIDALRRYMD